MELKPRLETGLLICFFLACGQSKAGSLRQLWEIKLDKIATDAVRAYGSVTALRFAPDGESLAVVTMGSDRSVDQGGALYVMSVREPLTGMHDFKIDKAADETGDLPLLNLQWSPDARTIDVGGTVINIFSGHICAVPDVGGFLSRDRLVTQDPADAAEWTKRYTSQFSGHFLIFDLACRLVESWSLGQDWFLNDTDPTHGVLLITHNIFGGYPQKSEVLIVDGIRRQVLQHFPSDIVMSPRFADGGQAVCGYVPDDADRDFVYCWDRRTGKEIGNTVHLGGAVPFAASQGSSRVVVSTFTRTRLPLSGEYTDILRGRMIWDFSKSKSVASWKPLLPKQPELTNEPFRFAISPDGQYIAEGGNGIIRLYRVEP